MAANVPVSKGRSQGCGPTIWLAGRPEELQEWMPLGIAGIVTNTVVLNQYAKPYGSVLDLIKKYLDITDKPVVVEIDGHSVEELLKVGKVFTNLSDQIILKIPCSVNGFKAFSILKDERLRPSAPRFLPDPGGRCSPSPGRPYPAFLRSGQGRRWRPDPTDTRVCADVQWLDTATNISWLRLSAQWRQRMRTFVMVLTNSSPCGQSTVT